MRPVRSCPVQAGQLLVKKEGLRPQACVGCGLTSGATAGSCGYARERAEEPASHTRVVDAAWLVEQVANWPNASDNSVRPFLHHRGQTPPFTSRHQPARSSGCLPTAPHGTAAGPSAV